MAQIDSDTDHLTEFSIEEIRDALGRVLNSDTIGKRSRLRILLEYIVEEEIENRGERLKAFAIGIDVMGRGPNFDPNADSIVRVEVNRLRSLLQEYYYGVGRNDSVVIEIPKGTYRPIFRAADNKSALPEKLASASLPFSFGATLGFATGVSVCVTFMDM